MPAEVSQSPPLALHEPNHSNVRPKGILKNPSFSGPSGQGPQSPVKETTETPPLAPLDPQDSKDLTLQNTLQNAGNRRSSSAARRHSASRRQSAAAGFNANGEDDHEDRRLKWDEANLYLAEQESGGRMKITEPKTPFEYGNNAMGQEEEEEEEDVSIDPRFVHVDEVEMAKNKGSSGHSRKARESEIPGLELGEAEDENAGADLENDRIQRQSSMRSENSQEKHVSVGESDGLPGMPTREEREKHKQFEEQRKKHYEMRNVKDMLGHPEDLDEDEDVNMSMRSVPNNNVNGGL